MKFKSLVSMLVCMSYVKGSDPFEKLGGMHKKVLNRLSSDFLTGFESGIFLRDNQAQFDEYGCPDQDINEGEVNGFKAALAPVKLMALGFQDNIPVVKEILDTVEAFVGSLDKFIGVFDESYGGGDFCAGLTFGMQGMEMLEKVAKNLYEDHIKYKAQNARSHGPPKEDKEADARKEKAARKAKK